MLKTGDKNRLVLEAAAKAAGWGAPLPAGVHRGVAVSDGFGSYAAMVAEVSVNAAGEPTVHRIVVAIDSGYVVNPDTCRAQAESNVVYGLGSILYQEINVKDGRVVESNFHDFPLPQIAEMPKVETVLVPTGGFWGGHGEPAILPLTPAVCNAIFAATGKRIRSLPLKHHDLRSGMSPAPEGGRAAEDGRGDAAWVVRHRSRSLQSGAAPEGRASRAVARFALVFAGFDSPRVAGPRCRRWQ